MTYQQVTLAIDSAAQLAARSAMDAFGPESIPTPEMAWDFVNDALYGDGEFERPAALPDVITKQFRHDYLRHVRNILMENPFEA